MVIGIKHYGGKNLNAYGRHKLPPNIGRKMID
jgi:hypothetical protein